MARVDRNLTNVQVAETLSVAYQTVEKWEHNRHPIGPKSRAKVVAFIGYDPDLKRS
jgi:DNA-binding transcriptional regulator YiaG